MIVDTFFSPILDDGTAHRVSEDVDPVDLGRGLPTIAALVRAPAGESRAG